MEEENTNTNQNGGTEPQGAAPKTYSQEEYDAQLAAGKNEVYAAFGIAADNAEAEIEAFKAWRAEQGKAGSQRTDSRSDDTLDEVKNQVTALTRQLAVVKSGIPSDKAERYVKLAASYMDDKTDFDAALKLALADFPLTTTSTAGKPAKFGGAVNSGKPETLPDEDKIKKIFEQKG